MTSQEKELLARFLQQLTEARAGQKDSEAEKLIQDAVARQPDAAYLLVQRALQLDQAFQASQAEALKLQTALDKARTSPGAAVGGGFLNDPNAWGSTPRASVAQSGAPQAAPVAAASAPVRPAPTPWGGGGMLGTMATTAAGVVAGSFLFQGIQGLMNRNDTQNDATKAEPTHSAQAEPEHVAQQDTLPEELGDTYADSGGDSGDFA
ncbi:MAG TPA: DUF2076 domain-containing protein [Burkholderiales bacterium]|nr:DUF2076 domain-containing protein [Burkholderiales bacterium]